ncbi:MAG: class I SAM-dependent methyltransferase [Pseudomonadota bacterium]
MSTPRQQLILQLAAAITVFSFAWPYYSIVDRAVDWRILALAIGATSLAVASAARQPWWWLLIHATFAPAAWLLSLWQINPKWFLFALILMLLIFRGTLTRQAPLYLTNRTTARALAELIPENISGYRVADVGAGLGSFLHPLARLRPNAIFTGLENSPLTWFLGRCRLAFVTNCVLRWKDLWTEDLSRYDLVYAFLSPVMMDSLGHKIAAELGRNAVFVSNSFPVPDATPWQIIDVEDRRRTRLYCYRQQDLQTWSENPSLFASNPL